MPRTKATRNPEAFENVKPNRTKLQKEMALTFIKAAEEDYLNRLKEIDIDHLLFKCKTAMNELIAKVPVTRLGKTLSELMQESEKSHYETASFKSFAANSTTKSFKNHTMSSAKSDSENRFRRRSKSQMTITKAKTARTSRSLSRTKVQNALTNPSNNFITPAVNRVLPATGTITPKMKANTPSVILRRPKQGEVAVSMQGSPLMVSSVASDIIANVNIPLQDGRIVSIQPNRGIRKSDIPDFDEDTRRQMEALRDNLIRVCQMHKNN